MYDITDEEEEALPLPVQWTRGMDLSGDVKYKNLKFGSESEEHPFIIQALNAARRLPLPPGWVVKKTLTEDGEEDFYFCEPESGLSGWDPPQLRECLGNILRRDGFTGAADRIHPPATPQQDADQTPPLDDEESDQEQEPEEKDEPVDTPPVSDTGAVDWTKLQENLMEQTGGDFQDQEFPSVDPLDQSKHHHHEFHDHDEPYRDHQQEQGQGLDHHRGAGGSLYPSSVASTKSKRSQKWREIKQYQSAQKSAKKPPSAGDVSKRNPAAITQQSVRALAAGVLEDNEKVHVLLMELREEFAHRRGLTCNLLFSNDNLNATNTPGAGVYPQDTVNALLRLGTELAGLVVGQPALVVRSIAALEQDYSEVDLIVYIVLHRMLHPFSSDNSRTTALLLEALNYQIEHAPWDPEDDTFAPQSVVSSVYSYPSHVPRKVKLPACTEQHALLCMLLLGVQESKHVPFFWKPLHRPFLRDYSYPEQHPSDSPGAESGHATRAPAYQETVLTSLLKSYGMRRDVSLFYRMVWRQVLPAIAGAVESSVGLSSAQSSDTIPTSTFSKLISLASRIIESAMLDDVSVIFPATATAMARCIAETCGKDGMYTYLLNYLLLPNLVKLLLGDNDCAENEDVYKQSLLSSLANKYFNYHEWWPTSASFVENKNTNKIRVTDSAGVLIWCVWRIFTCAVFTEPSELTIFSAAKFFSNIGINETYTEVADTRIRNVVTRMRLKIEKGCQCLLKLPLDAQGSDFLEETSFGNRVKLHTKSMGALLNKRIHDLMLKPSEMQNAVVISRQDTIVIFDALAFVLEAQQVKYQRESAGTETDEEDCVTEWRPPLDVDEVLLDIQDYLGMCDAMDEMLVEEAAGRQGAQELNVEDVLLLWSELESRHETERMDYEYEYDEHSYGGDESLLGNVDRERNASSPHIMDTRREDNPPDGPPPIMLPPYPYEDEAYHSLSQRSAGDGDDFDDDFLDDVTMFSDIPPPPDGPALDTAEYQHDQLCRGAALQQRYIASLLAMLRRIRADEPCNLTSLLENDAWFYSPEVDISHRLAVNHNNIFDKYTSSSFTKSRPNAAGALMPKDVTSRAVGKGKDRSDLGDYTGLANTQKNFFNSLRFSDARPRANTRTSVDININRNAPRLVNNMVREHLITKHDPDHGFHEAYEKIYHESHGRRSDPQQAAAMAKQHQQKPRYTKVTLSENSPLLVPTVSLCCKPATRQPHGAIHKSYINSLRAPDPEPTESDKKKRKPRSSPGKNARRPAASISPTRPLVSFPEHLRDRVRHDPSAAGVLESSLQRSNSLFNVESNNHSDYYEQQKLSGKNNFHGQEKRSQQYLKSKYNNANKVQSKAKERKMPTPVHGTKSENLYSATISHSLKLEYDDDFEITAEQEKGWMAQLRSWEAMDSYQGRVIAPVLRKPFFPSGHVEPVRMPNQQRRVPDHLTPGKNRRNSRRRSQSNASSTGLSVGSDWYDYRKDSTDPKTSSADLQQSPPRGARGQYASYDDYLRASEAQQRLVDRQESEQGANTDPFPGGDSKQLAETLQLLRSQTQQRQQQDAQGSSKSGDSEGTLSSAGSPQASPQHNDPALQEAARQTQGVLDRLRQRLDQKKGAQQTSQDNEQRDTLQEDQGHENAENLPLNSNNGSKLAESASKLLARTQGPSSDVSDPLPHPELKTFPSSYSLSFDGHDSPLKEQPRRRDDQEVLSKEDEERYLEEYTRHQAECEMLSPSELRRRMVSKGRWQEESDDDEVVEEGEGKGKATGDKEEVPKMQSSNDVSSPSRTATASDNSLSNSSQSVPVIARQISTSALVKREKLMAGFEVTKFADVGYSKKKMLTYDPTSQELQWRPVNTSVFSRFKGPPPVKAIKLQHITEVHRGIESAALRKAGLLDPQCCLCINTNQEKDGKPRSLDVVFKLKTDRDMFVRGLEVILQSLGLSAVRFL